MDLNSLFPSLFSREWPEEFSQNRKPFDDRSFVEGLLEAIRASKVRADGCGDQRPLVEVEPDGDEHELFMQAYVGDELPLDLKRALQFLKVIKDHKLHDQIETGKKGTAWLDDRTYNRNTTSMVELKEAKSQRCNKADAVVSSTQPSQAIVQKSSNPAPITRRTRSYHAPLNAVDLHRFLREKLFDHDEYLDADRRLIYIANPDAYDLSALITTARPHQERALRDAICKYLILATSIRATLRPGYSEFQLEFNISFFAMRRSQPEQDFAQRVKRTHRGWMNLSFLDSSDTDPETDGVCGIHQAHISVTIGGTENTRWFVYCFEDTHFDEDGELGQDEQTEEHQSDQVARGEFGAENTIWDPREYFLLVFLTRMRQVKKEWQELVRFIETGIKEHSWGRFFFTSARDGTPQLVNDSAASSRLDCTSQLLCKLTEDIAKTNTAWQRFKSPTGEWAFIVDQTSDKRMKRTFSELHDIFEDIREMELTLQRIAAQCEKRAQTVNLRVASDSKRSAELGVYFVSPFAIVSAFFAIPVPIITFPRNLLTFLIATLLYTVALRALLYVWGGQLGRQQWWQKLLRRARALMSGDAGLTAQKGGVTVLQRRSTHSGFV